jgi:hypothetical protein
MTNSPADLLGFRRQVMAETGLADPADIGIVGDGAHARTGGYHEGHDVLVAIGRYHPGAQYVGSSVEDYSCRLGRDRAGLTDSASALDIGAQWPRGGRLAWLRFNNSLVRTLQAGDPALAAIRAVNYSPDGTSRHRIDRQYGFNVIEDSTDSVDVHTHIEWYRDTEGNRQTSLDRLVALVRAARDNTTPTAGKDPEMMLIAREKGSPNGYIGDGVTRRWIRSPEDLTNTQNVLRMMGYTEAQVALRDGWNPGTIGALGELVGPDPQSDTVTEQIAAQSAKLDAITAAFHTLATAGTSVDTAAVLTAVHEVGAAESQAVADLKARVADLTARLAAAGHALEP